MINLYLIRHAESDNNKNYHHLVGGRSNHTPLTPLGELQSEQLGTWLKDKGIFFDEAHASTAIRATNTAKISLPKPGFPLEKIIYSDELLELHQGDWQQKLRSEVYSPQTKQIINQDPWNFKAPNGESQKEVEDRMLRYICASIISPNQKYVGKKDISVAVYSHGMAIKCTLRGILGFEPIMTRKIDIDNTSITKLSYQKEGWFLHYINRTNHLK